MFLLLLPMTTVEAALSDPTRPLGFVSEGGKAGKPVLQLQSILISGERKIAIINGEKLREGDEITTVNNSVVREIKPYEVLVDQSGKIVRLSLRTQIVKRKKAE